MSFQDRWSVIVRSVLLLGLFAGALGAPPAPARAMTVEESGSSTLVVDSCDPDFPVWRWTTGPLQPEAARQAEEALRQQGIESSVVATGFGEKDACGNFELYSTDFTVTLSNGKTPSTQGQDEISQKILSALSHMAAPQLGNVQIHFGTDNTAFYPSSTLQLDSLAAPDQSTNADAIPQKKVYVLIFDPILSNGQNLSAYMGWNSPSVIAQDIVNYFPTASNGQIQHAIVHNNIVTNGWPALVDGFTYTESTYFDVLYGRTPPHSPDTANYDKIVDDYGICQKVNNGEIDELWMFGAPWFGFYESRLLGPNAYQYNSPPMAQTHGCSKLIPIMGLNYERGLSEAIHSFGHRTEAVMTKTYGYWEENNTRHGWEKFGLVKAQSPNYSYSGCGSIHFPPNGVQGYDYANLGSTPSNCDDFWNYPNLSDPLLVATPVTCTAWGCTQLGYLSYWYSHLPSVANCDQNAIANNWWLYFADPNLALYPSLYCSPPPCPTITEWHGEYWNNSSLIGPPVVCRNDAAINFDWGSASPDPLIAGDHFSARWTRTIDFSAGIYRFQMMNDDGARLYVDDVLKLDAWTTCCSWRQVDVPLTAGGHIVRMEMFENDGGAAAKLVWGYVGSLPTSTPTPTPTNTPTNTPTPTNTATPTSTSTPIPTLIYTPTPISAGDTVRVSVNSNGGEGNNTSLGASISPDGRYVGFISSANNLVSADGNGVYDAFIHDRQTGMTIRASVNTNGAEGNAASYYPTVSADGRYVAFYSFASNLVLGDTNSVSDIFLRDTQTGVTTRISVDSSGVQGNKASSFPSISADGRFIVFESSATNLVAGDNNGVDDIFLYNVQTSTITRISVDGGGGQANGGSSDGAISADGRYITYYSSASNLVLGDTNGLWDVFRFDQQTSTTALASANSSGVQGNNQSYNPSISGDGRYIAFTSYATNLSSSVGIGSNIFLRDMQTGMVTLVTVDSNGMPANDQSLGSYVSGDGRHVAFTSHASNLTSGDSNNVPDVFIHDMQTGLTKRVSVSSTGTQADDASSVAAISGDGSYVVFESGATNLVAADSNLQSDVFVHRQDFSAPTATPTFTPTATPAYSYQPLYLSLTSSQTIGGVSSADEDILKFDGQSWSLFFDGSDVGVGGSDLFAFALLDPDSLLMSFSSAVTVNGIAATAQDVLRFDATSLGSTTTGSFSMYFDGSDVGFDTSGESIDSLSLLPDGRLLLSTTGSPSVPGASGKDEDVLAFTPVSLGDGTAGTWKMYFDGSDVGLADSSNEDVDALDVAANGNIYLSTLGDFAVPGIAGSDEDVFICAPTSIGDVTICTYSSGLYFDGSTWGLSGNDVDAFNLIVSGSNPPATPTNTPTATATATSTSTSGPTATPTNTSTATPTNTSGPTSTPTNTPTATSTSTSTPTPTNTPTNTPTPTAGSGTGTTLTFSASADSYVRVDKPTNNYGTNTTIWVDGGTDPTYEGFLKFTVSGVTGTVQSAVLRVYASSGTANTVAAYGAGSSWTETGLTWNNKPARTTGSLAAKGPITSGSWVEYNVTVLVTGDGTYTLILAMDNIDSAGFVSREGTQPPQLVLTIAP